MTRRYANSTVPGSWYSALVDVPAGVPFTLRMRETFDGATTKEFNLYVDGVLEGRYTLSRSQTGSGWLAHDLVVESPAALAVTGDGQARLKFEFPLDASGYDPSIADAWIIPAAADDVAPLFAAAYGVTDAGNWEGTTILSRLQDDATLAERFGLQPAEVARRLAVTRDVLLARRATRPQPARDDKVLAGWNGLAIRNAGSGLCPVRNRSG